MSLTQCSECGSRVSAKAALCPTCGAQRRKASGCVMALAWLFAIFFLLMAVGVFVLPPSQKPSDPESTVDQEAGRQFIGLTKADLIAKFGQPVATMADSHPEDGEFEILTYDNSDGNATLFTIWAEDGLVSSGQYRGKYFFKKE